MDIDKIKKKYEELNKRRENRGYWKQKPGPNELRVLPSWTGDPSADFYYETSYHWNLGPDKKKNCVCLKALGKDFCPICDFVKELYASNDKENATWAKDIKANTRVFWNIVDMDEYHQAITDKREPKGVQIMATGSDVLHQFLGFCVNPKYGDLTDPMKGRNITLIFTKGEDSKTGWNDYVVQPDPDRTPIEDIKWLEHLADLEALVEPIEPEAMKAMLQGEEVESSSGSESKAEPGTEIDKPAQEKRSCRSRYDDSDGECAACDQKDLCIEERKARLTKAVEQPKTSTPEVKKEEVKLSPPASTDKATDIENMMATIRKKQAAKKEGK